MASRYFNSDGTVKVVSPRGQVGGKQHFNMAYSEGSASWTTPNTEMQSTLRSTITSQRDLPPAKASGVRTAPAIDCRSRPSSPRKLADIRGQDIFSDGDRGIPSKKPVSKKKCDELAGTILKDLKEKSAPVISAPARDSARARKMNNLVSIAFDSSKMQLPVTPVSSKKIQHLSGNLPFPEEPMQLRTLRKMPQQYMGQKLGPHEALMWDHSSKVFEGPRVRARPSTARPVGGKCQIVLG